MHKKGADEQSSDPRYGCENPPLRAVALPVGKKGVVENKGKRDEEQGEKKPLGSAEDFDQAEEREKIDPGIEKKAVSLVEEKIQKSISVALILCSML